jgi:hypothetical protein
MLQATTPSRPPADAKEVAHGVQVQQVTRSIHQTHQLELLLLLLLPAALRF